MGRLGNAFRALMSELGTVRHNVRPARNEAGKSIALSSSDLPWLTDSDDISLYKTKGSASSIDAMVRAFIGWTYVCTSLNAQVASKVPLRLYVIRRQRGTKFNFRTQALIPRQRAELFGRKHLQRWTRKADAEDVEEITEHPFLDVLDAANPIENGFDLLYRVFMFMQLTGNAYWYLKSNGLGVPSEIWTRMPQHMKIQATRGFLREVTGYRYQRKGDIHHYDLKPEEVVHFQQPNSQSLLYGWGNLAASALPVDIAKAMLEYEEAIFGNEARPDFALNIKGGLSDAARKRLKADIRAKFKGHRKSGIPIVTEAEGGMEIKPLAFPPKEMAFLQGNKMVMVMICAAHHVPVSLVTTEDVNRSNAEIGRRLHAESAIRPLLTLVEGKINERLIPQYGDQVFVAFDDVVGEDMDVKLKARETNLKLGYTTINDERAEEGKDPYDWGKVPLLPMTMAPLGTALPEPDEQLEPEERAIHVVGKALRRQRIAAEYAARRKGEPKIEAWLQTYFTAQEREAQSALTKSAKNPEDAMFTIGLDKWNKRFVDGFNPIYKALVYDNGSRILSDLPVEGVAFDIDNPGIVKHMETHIPKLAGEVNEETLKLLQAALQEGVAAGEAIPDIKKRIAKVFADRKGWEAKRIARTEMCRAQSVATEEAFKQSGVVRRKVWLTAMPCEICAPYEGMTIELGDAFTTTSYGAVEYPPLHPNCRCVIVEELG